MSTGKTQLYAGKSGESGATRKSENASGADNQQETKNNIKIAVIRNDGDRSSSTSWMVAIKIDRHQFNGRHFSDKLSAYRVAKTVVDFLGIKDIEDVAPIWD